MSSLLQFVNELCLLWKYTSCTTRMFSREHLYTVPGDHEHCMFSEKVKAKVVGYSPGIHDYACSTNFTFPLARWAPMQPAAIDPTLDLCTRYPLWLSGPRQCGIQSLPDTSTHDSAGNRTPDLLILSPIPYLLGHVFPWPLDGATLLTILQYVAPAVGGSGTAPKETSMLTTCPLEEMKSNHYEAMLSLTLQN